ncbi:MAG: hypothetical protein ACP5NZ_01770 [Nanobdellota archaeon]
MKPLDRKTTQFVHHELNLLRSAINLGFNSMEDDSIIPTTDIIIDVRTLFDIETDISESLGNRNLVHRN